LNPGDALVLNNTKVIPARFHGYKTKTKGKVGILLSRVMPDGSWIALVTAKRKMQIGDEITLKNDSLTATIINKVIEEPGAFQIKFNHDILKHAEEIGEIPLPPYIKRVCNEIDNERYQTVFADDKQNQAVAAPTAGLHFDQELLEQIKNKGVRIIYITLHVGPGTFLPIRTDNINEHQMHAEPWFITEAAATQINEIKNSGGRIIAVGTTCVRTLESATDDANKLVKAGSGLTRLFIKPGFKFKIVDSFITNFHLPKTTLLLLVAAAIGNENLAKIYQEAIEQNYRFFSYGDACFFDVMDLNI
ncbi:MAG: tRNA preQ1(34) S-adenosylmethionine ribosyltransferase-isomerase QueA, partial [bacterium]|nr:tRNA preQ1(34) S-adenosylmethionine ribosyltransferase-isomerase QueA [bacterium]